MGSRQGSGRAGGQRCRRQGVDLLLHLAQGRHDVERRRARDPERGVVVVGDAATESGGVAVVDVVPRLPWLTRRLMPSEMLFIQRGQITKFRVVMCWTWTRLRLTLYDTVVVVYVYICMIQHLSLRPRQTIYINKYSNNKISSSNSLIF